LPRRKLLTAKGTCPVATLEAFNREGRKEGPLCTLKKTKQGSPLSMLPAEMSFSLSELRAYFANFAVKKLSSAAKMIFSL
jgi:hypothetical protein